MGQLEVSGPAAREGLAAVLTNDLSAIGPGQGQYTLLCQDDGGVIDDLIVYALADRYLLVVNASNVEACRDRLAERLPGGADLADRSPEVAMLALQGPRWADALRPLAETPLAFTLDYFDIGEDRIAGVPCLIARTGYTGEPGVELMCPWDGAPAVWDALMGVEGAPAPAGLVARDTLRLEMGYPLYGQELSRERTPIEAGLRWACDIEGGGLRRRGGDAPPGRRGHRRAAHRLRAHRAGHPARRARTSSSTAPRPAGSPAGRSLRPSTSGSAWPTCRPRPRRPAPTWSSTSAGSRRPPAPPAARSWRHPRRNRGAHVAAADESYPSDLRYHPEHDWVRADGDEHVFGITWYAQDALGEVVYYDPPEVGATITKDAPYGELESVKAVSDIFAPASGEVVAVNPAVNDAPRGGQRGPLRRGLAGAGEALGSRPSSTR